MHVNATVWAMSVIGIVAIIIVDFFIHVRRPHVPPVRESAMWIAVYVCMSLLFGLGLGLVWDWGHAGQYFAGYLTEESLSFDNLFVFLLIITKFRVPRVAEQKVLAVGVSIALVLRAAFILVGAAAIQRFSWVFYLFGLILLYTAVKVFREKHGDTAEYPENGAVRLMRRLVHTSPDFVADKVRVTVDGHKAFTPLLIVMVAIGSTDVMFALDSIPAIFGLTKEPYIVFMANAFALMGLRQIYFLLGALVARLPYLSKGLSFILAFIAVKLVLEALHANDLAFVNGGEPVPVPEIPIALSLGVIVGTLAVVTAVSLLRPPGQPDGGASQD